MLVILRKGFRKLLADKDERWPRLHNESCWGSLGKAWMDGCCRLEQKMKPLDDRLGHPPSSARLVPCADVTDVQWYLA
ncbi:unnamed protein product [Victoria cruziana]